MTTPGPNVGKKGQRDTGHRFPGAGGAQLTAGSVTVCSGNIPLSWMQSLLWQQPGQSLRQRLAGVLEEAMGVMQERGLRLQEGKTHQGGETRRSPRQLGAEGAG